MGTEKFITIYPEETTFIPRIEDLFIFINLLRKKGMIKEEKRIKSLYSLKKGIFKEKETKKTHAYYSGSYGYGWGYGGDTHYLSLSITLSQSFVEKLVKILKNVKGHSRIVFDENENLQVGKELNVEMCNKPDLVCDGDGEGPGDSYSSFLLEWGGKWLTAFNLDDGIRDKIMSLFEKDIAPLFNKAFKVNSKIGFAISA